MILPMLMSEIQNMAQIKTESKNIHEKTTTIKPRIQAPDQPSSPGLLLCNLWH